MQKDSATASVFLRLLFEGKWTDLMTIDQAIYMAVCKFVESLQA